MTLHEFVLTLISDPAAQADFDADPHACLTAAGLTDVTPADVRDAIPLVADYAPARVAGLTSGLPDLTSATLQRPDALLPAQPLVTGLTTGNLSAAAVSGGAHLSGDAGPFGYSGGAHLDTTDPGVPHISVHTPVTVHDPVGTLHPGILDPGTLDPGTLHPGTLDPGGTVGHTVGSVTDPLHGLTGPLDHGGLLDTGHGLDGVTSGVDGVTGGLHGLTGGLDGVTGGLHATGLLDDPLHLSGSASTSVHGDADPGLHLPDVTHLL